MPPSAQPGAPGIDLSRLLRPKSIAIVGISPEPRSPGFMALRNMTGFGYEGSVHLVSRSHPDIDGVRCVKSIDDLPDGVDVALLLLPRVAIEDAVAACARRHVGGVVVFAAGFYEAGGEWAEAQDRIAATARDNGMALCGPNCMGIVDFAHRVPLTFGSAMDRPPEIDGGLALIAQSGGLAHVVRRALVAKGIPVTCTVSTGNEAVLGLEDYAAFLVEDPDTWAVVAFAEQIRRPQRFLEMVARARELGKPVVLLMSGRSEAARESARSHTGALAGDHQLIQAILRHQSVVLVEGLDELIDVSELVARFREPPTKGLAVVTDSGAVKGMVLDQCDALGLDVPPFPPALAERISAELPDFVGATNPLDVTAQALIKQDMYERTVAPILADDTYGSVLLAVILGTARDAATAKGRHCLAALEGTQKPAIIGLLGDETDVPTSVIEEAHAQGVPFFRSPERALRALARFTAYGRSLAARRTRPSRQPRAVALPEHRGVLSEHRAKAFIAANGIPVPEGALVSTAVDARESAAALGYPVAMKLQSAQLAHKSDVGGVVLNIRTEQQLATAWDRLQEVAADRPEVEIDGVLVETMAAGGLEMIVGGRRDPDWGPVAVVGLGGIWTEALADARILPVDLSKEEIVDELGRLKGARLLKGARGMAPRDVGALANAVVAVADLMVACPDLVEIDINPLTVYEDGAGVLALDALVISR